MKAALAFATATLVLAISSGCEAAPADVAGRYSNVRHIPVADDYVGLNLEISNGPRPTVRYELCEGWCNGALVFPARVQDGVVRFTVREPVFSPDSSTAAPLVYRVEVRFKRGLLGRRAIATSPDLPEFREVLRPVAKDR